MTFTSCRVAEMDQATLSASLEPPAASAPKKWSICFSCSRDSTASDGPQGAHSPFAQELLDEKAGIFAAGVPLKGGLDQACQRMREQHQGQAPMAVGLPSIKEDWCFDPNPAQRVSSALGNVPSPTAGKAPSPDRPSGGPFFFYFFTFSLLFLGHCTRLYLVSVIGARRASMYFGYMI